MRTTIKSQQQKRKYNVFIRVVTETKAEGNGRRKRPEITVGCNWKLYDSYGRRCVNEDRVRGRNEIAKKKETTRTTLYLDAGRLSRRGRTYIEYV